MRLLPSACLVPGRILTLCTFLGLGAAGALAAELPPAPVLEEDGAATRGWYLRADAGLADLSLASRFRIVSVDEAPALSRARIDRSLDLGAGVGYRLSPLLRADVTLDHRVGGTLRATRFGPAEGFALDRADVSETTILANGYLDLALLEGITPYVGAGIGAARERTGATARLSVAADGVPTGSVAAGGGSGTRLAWAAMTGVAIDWSRNLQFDFGYRYVHSDDRTPRFAGSGRNSDPGGSQAHELRFGARFPFN
ncbi:MAG: outer membrane beta-barrel protein [Microvirga sp.]